MRSPISDYLLSLPERVLRSGTALAAGLLRETGDVVIPGFVRQSRLYSNLVDSTLRFLIEQVGQVEGTYPGQDKLAEDFLLRRTAGNGLELIGVLTFHASPVWVMAALADVSGAGRQLIAEITAELQKQGLLEPGMRFDTVDQMLDGLERTSAKVANTCNTPPLDVATLRAELAAITREAATIPAPAAETLWSAWRELQAESTRQGRSVFELSTLMALSAFSRVPEHLLWIGKSTAFAARKTGEVLASALLDHYRQSLQEIHNTGYMRYWLREFRPYLRGAALQFSPKRKTLTERLLPLLLLLCLPLQAAAITPADLRAHVEMLASDLLAGRNTPSPGLDIAAEYIAVQFRRAGLEPLADGTYFQTESPGKRNVVGVLPGTGTGYVLVTAHYDHVGTKQEGEGDLIYNGANDNASGVASMIEIAGALAGRPRKPRRSVVFIAYYGEEGGMIGSRYYAANPLFPIAETVAQINIEQTGRPDDNEGPNLRTLNVTGFERSDVAEILRAAAEPLGVRVVKREKWTDMAFERSDNEALAKLGVPAHTISVAYIFPDYHRVGDHWDKLDYKNMAEVTKALAAGVVAIANRVEPPRWHDANTTRPAAPPKASAPKPGSSPANRTRPQSTQSPKRLSAKPAGQTGTAPRQRTAPAPAK